MAEIASSHGLYGGNCSYDRVYKELLGYSDHQLHQFASERSPPLNVTFVLDVQQRPWSIPPSRTLS